MSGADMSLQVQSSALLNGELLLLRAGSWAGSSSHSSRQKAAGSTVGCPSTGLASPGNTQGGMEGVLHPLSLPVPTEQVWDGHFPRDSLTDSREMLPCVPCPRAAPGAGRAAVTLATSARRSE